MAIETFAWATPAGVSGTPAFDVLKANFADGYTQTAPNGLNNKRTSWTMTFTGQAAYIKAIKDFIDRHAGARSFYWTPPLEGQALFKGKYTQGHKGGDVHSLSVTFDQDFKP